MSKIVKKSTKLKKENMSDRKSHADADDENDEDDLDRDKPSPGSKA